MRLSQRLLIAVLAAVAAVALAALAHAQRAAKAPPSVYTVPGQTVYPEGIAMAEDHRHFFVGSTSDGAIFRGDVRRGALRAFATRGLDGRTTALGMKADSRHLFVAGGATGKVFALDVHTGRTAKVLDSAPNGAQTTINDLVLARGYGYATDSRRPVVLRFTRRGRSIGALRPWLDLTNTPFKYQEGFNANGIAAYDHGRALVVVQSNTGKLFRIDTRTKNVSEIDLGGATLPNGDGLVARGNGLYVVRNADRQITVVALSRNLRSGHTVRTISSDRFMFPTTAALSGRRLLVVNSQFDKRNGGVPVLPFNVVAVPR